MSPQSRQFSRLLVSILVVALIIGLWPVSVVLAATQSIGGVASTGNLLVSVYDNGSMSVQRYDGSSWVHQMFGSIAKGTKLFYNSTPYHFGGESSCTLSGTQGATVSNSTSGDTITTVWTAGSVQVTQRTSYTNGNAYYRIEWDVYNASGSTINDVRVLHGEDTYLAGSDTGGGWWDGTYNTIGVVKIVNGNEQRMSLQGVTAPYSYASANYSTVCTAMNNGSLGGLIDSNQSTDNGYALEWRLGSLAAGATWTITAYEKFVNGAIGGLSVTAPINVNCTTGTSCNVNYSVRNVGSTTVNATFSVSGDQPWNPTITSGTSASIAGGATTQVTVQVSVPGGTANGTVGHFPLTANDGSQNTSDTASVTATAPPNTAPTASSSSSAGYPNQAQNGSLNVSDAEGNISSCSISSYPAHYSSLSCSASGSSGSFSYSPSANYAGSDSFSYYVCDSYGACSGTATVSIGVNNRAPSAAGDSYSTNEDTTLSVAAAGIMSNDSDPDSQPLIASLSTGVAHGSLTLNSDGSFSYTPSANYNGADSFTYRVYDGYNYSGAATVNLTVNPVNDLPTSANTSVTTNEDTDKAFAGADFPFSDVDTPYQADSLQAVRITALETAGTLYYDADSDGVVDAGEDVTLNQSITAANLDRLKFKPQLNDNGASYDAFRFRVSDGTAYSTADYLMTINVTAVNDAPVNSVPGAQVVDEDTLLPGLVFSVADVDQLGAGDLRFTLSASHGSLTLHTVSGLTLISGGNNTHAMTYQGTLAAINNALNGVSYLPDLNYNLYAGAEAITLTSNDAGHTGVGGVLTDTDSVSVVVNAVNDPPVNTMPAPFSVDEDTARTGLVFNIADDALDSATSFEFTLSSSYGNLTLAATSGLTLISGGNGTRWMSYRGALPAITAALTGVTYQPVLNYNGPDTIILESRDNQNTGSGSAYTDLESVDVTVVAVDDPPVNVVPGSQVMNEDGILTNLNFSVSDVDELGTTHFQFTLTAAHGSITVTPAGLTNIAGSNGSHSLTYEGSLANVNAALANVTYQPDANYNGADTLQLLSDDNGHTGILGGQTDSDPVAITINPSNDAPTAAAGTVTTNEDTDRAMAVSDFNFSDVDTPYQGDALQAVQITALPAVGALYFDADANGLIDFGELVVADQIVTATSLSQLKFKPIANQNGAGYASFRFKVSDGTTFSSPDYLMTIDVVAVNDAPVNTVPGAQVVNEDTDLSGLSFSVADLDQNGTTEFRFTLSAQHGTLTITPAGLTLVSGSNGSHTLTYEGTLAAINAALASVTYRGDPDYNGSDSLTLISNDKGHTGLGGALTDTDTVTVTITAVNDAPVIESGSTAITVTMSEDASPTAFALTLQAADADIAYQGDVLTWSIATAAAHGTAAASGTGTSTAIGYAPAANYNGADSFVVEVDDGHGSTDTIVVNVAITPVNDAPAAADQAVTTNEDIDYVFAPGDFAFSDVDTPYQGDTLQAIKLTSLETNGALYLDVNSNSTIDAGEDVALNQVVTTANIPQLKFKPALNASGAPYATFRFAVSDGTAYSGVDYQMQIDVAAVNDPPVNTVPGAQSLNEDSSISGLVFSVADVDENGASDLQFVLSAAHGRLDLNTTAGLTLISGANHSTTMTYQGALSAINAALNGVTYTPDPNYNLHAGAEAITLTANDNGHTGLGGSQTDTDVVSVTVNAVNDPPVNVVPGGFSIDEDTDTAPLVFHINDDAIASATTFEFRLQASYGMPRLATVNGLTCTVATDNRWVRCTGALPDINAALNGVIYRSILDYHGPDTLVLTTWDHGNTGSGGEYSDIDSVPITVVSINDAPVNVVPGPQTVAEETNLSGLNFSFSDVDENSANDLQITLAANHGSVTLAGTTGLTLISGSNGSHALTYQGALANLNAALQNVTYQGDVNFADTDTLMFTSNDTGHTGAGGSQTDVDTVAITVTNVNDAPVAANDSVTTPEDTALTIDALSNDSDPDLIYHDALTIVRAGTPGHGLSATDGATIIYTPTLNYNGADSFTYTIRDLAGLTSTATITLDVTPVNDAPVAAGESYTATEDTPLILAAAGVLSNDSDVDNVTLFAVKDSDPAHGTLTLNPDGSAAYTPTLNYNGPDSFMYHANDGSLDSNSVTVYLAVTGVNDAPSAANDSASTAEDTPVTIAVLSNDNDPDVVYGDVLSVALVGTPAHGVATTDGASVIYTPTLNYNGPDSFTYTARDVAGLTSNGTVTLNVSAVNDAPVNTVPNAPSVDEDTALGGLIFGAADVDENGASDLWFTMTAQHGTLNLASTSGLVGTGNGTAALIYTGTLVNLNAALNGITYHPAANYFGVDTITVQTNDSGHTGAGGILHDTDSVSVTVVPVNDPPVNTVPGAQIINEDTDLPGLVMSIADDTLPAATNFEFRVQASHGTVTLAATAGLSLVDGGNGTHWLRYRGTLAAINTALNGVTYRGDLNYNGPDTIVLFANDNGNTGGGALTDLDSFDINVLPVNDAPRIASTPTLSAIQGVLYTYAITVTDIDAGDVETITATSLPAWLTLTDHGDGTATLNGVPGNAHVGDNAVALNVRDAAGATDAQSFTIAVANVNDAPTFTSTPITTATQDVAYTYQVTANDIDAGDVLTITTVTKPAWLTLIDHGDGTALLSGTPGNADVGDHAVVVQVHDRAGAVAAQAYTVTVANVNDAPYFVSTPLAGALQGVVYTYVITTTDIDAVDTLTITAASKPAWLMLIDHGDGTATLSGTPANSDVGDHAVMLNVHDVAGAAATQSFTITVVNTNDAPLLTSTPITTATQDVLYSYQVTADDIDAGDALSITAVTKPAWLTLIDHGDGTAALSGTPANADVGDHAVVVQVHDRVGATAQQAFTVTVANVNDAPLFTSSPITAAAIGAAYTYTSTVVDIDAGDSVTITAVTKPAWLTLVDHGDGTATLSGIPSVADLGDAVVALLTTDRAGAFATQAYTLTVTTPDLAVSLVPSQNSTVVGAHLTYHVLISNTGLVSAQMVSVTDTLPSAVTFTQAHGAACTATNNVVNCTIDTLAAGQIVDVVIDVTVTEINTAPLINTAEVATASVELNTSNNAASVTITANPYRLFLPLSMKLAAQP